VIRTFRNKDTRAVFSGEFVKGLDRRIQQRAREKLKYRIAAGWICADPYQQAIRILQLLTRPLLYPPIKPLHELTAETPPACPCS